MRLDIVLSASRLCHHDETISSGGPLKRRLRIERRLLIALADGSTLTMDPGECWLDEDRQGGQPELTWHGRAGLESGPVSSAVINLHLTRREIVFTSW